ncbi:chorismate synthase [Rhizophagus irregularis]|uniref:Chorismate synthase n=3 Tax=Rhizophagus irregularis TaxID=588596 RepID=U9SZB6_RHIID|nr:chorismate synthase [Rhizophagus irregularis DAOM 181602=DAOM 197198]EXX73564.1 bifunctional chorismate synthase/riboflavin reductase [NAD(P)H] ARO2 [Rhizophagus irregularis DAOM 197198w]PKB99730.1 chorismate synthase [Rhizophagus irregularis]PKC57468.1 chorismate synthase [Rhizophagus irregularis]PKK61049.1 chorismate synthase [Rhizophagus irregularis]PKY30742.1 chorismate synthase [Rhizophagus irregularis]|eukprot:XP_025164547.1 chorismate synthase [Rhizophagus irregularis DAOM 181602=DAOM 197198]
MSTFGTLFRVTTFGESHGKSVGCIVDGCPPGLSLVEADIQIQLDRRRPGQSNLTTPRDEKDKVAIQSGTESGITLGTPIGLLVPNQDQRPHDYSETDLYPRPSHADWTYLQKYSIKASSGGGRASARETIGRVAAGAIAEKYLKLVHGVEIVAFVSSVSNIAMPFINEQDERLFPEDFWELLNTIRREEVDKDAVRCPDKTVSDKMRERIHEAKEAKDSVGGTITCVIRNVPVGLGEPCFDKLEAKFAHAMLSIPATKGFEIGSGFKGTTLFGHQHNDPWVLKNDRLGTKTNNSGGTQGGITNGENIYFRVAFKPPATISQEQETATYNGVDGVLAARGRHDPCVVPRAVPIVESMAALVIMDALMIQQSRKTVASLLPPNPNIPAAMSGVIPKLSETQKQ